MNTPTKLHRPAALKMEVLERALDPKRITQLLEEYHGAKKNSGGHNRVLFLERPITEDEMDYLRFYLDETDEPISIREKQLKLSPGTLSHKIRNTALKWLYQHREDITL